MNIKNLPPVEITEKTVKKSFTWPIFDETEVEAVAEVVRSGKWGNPDCGDLVEEFEKEFAAYCGCLLYTSTGSNHRNTPITLWFKASVEFFPLFYIFLSVVLLPLL